jgi:NAD(P)-dependent dehydrogenase (short-subunit alcohol dehydrogenase family)
MLRETKPVVFITGVSSGIGLNLAKGYLQKGYLVSGCSVESLEEVQEFLPPEIFYQQCDVRNTADVEKVIKRTHQEFGTLDLVIANAGINHPKAKIPDFEFGTKVIDINVNGVLNTFGPSIEIMKEQGHGQLVALSSMSATLGALPGMAIYCASKAAVLSLCETLEMDLRRYGIYVTTLAPGFIETPLIKDNDHSMPFKMTVESAVKKMIEAIEKKRTVTIFPWQMSCLSTILNMIPRPLYKWIIGLDVLKTGQH